MSRQLTEKEIAAALELEGEEDNEAFEDSGDESDHISCHEESDEDSISEVQECASTEIRKSGSSNSDSEMDEPLLNLTSMGIYKGKDGTVWKKCPPNTHVRTRSEDKVVGIPGVQPHAKNAMLELDCFNLFVNNYMLEEILIHTNRKIRTARMNKASSNEYSYSETDIVELKAVVGLLFLAGICRSGRQNLQDLWAKDGTGVEIFPMTMSLRRFTFLVNCLRFDNADSREERKALDKLAPIRRIYEDFIDNCKRHYTPYEYLTIDEELVAFRGRCSFRQYIPSKPAKYGLKIIALVDAKTYYSLNMEVYLGEQPEGPYKVSNKPHDVIDRLVEPISKTGRNLTMDNWFTSYITLQHLFNFHKLTAVGTLKSNKTCILVQFKDRREVNSTLFGFQRDMTLLSYIPKPNKNVFLLSSLHHDGSIDPETGHQQKPEIITFYNKTKSGVDIVDKLVRTYDVSRNSQRWPLTLFFWILNTAGINAKIIHMLNNPDSNSTRREFLKSLSMALIRPHLVQRKTNQRIPVNLRKRIGTHLGEEGAPPTKKLTTGVKSRCYICPRNKDRKSKLVCVSCRSHVCTEHANTVCETCFENNGQESDED